MSINLAKPMETVRQNPFVLCAWPSFADQPYITNYRIYDDRVGETTRFCWRRSESEPISDLKVSHFGRVSSVRESALLGLLQ